MSTQTEKPKDNLLVKLVKKSVGLPTSDCCGAPAQVQETEACCGEQSATAAESSGCECSKAEVPSCGCGQEKKAEGKTA